MRVDPRESSASELYRFLITAVVPRPIAWVSTRSPEGLDNLAPFSFFNAITSEPPILMIAINERAGDPKDTLRNIRATGEFVINVVTAAMLEPMVRTAGEWSADTSEFDVAGVTRLQSERVQPPSVREAPIQIECRLHQELQIGRSVVVFGEMLLARVDDSAVREGRIDAALLAPVGRLGGEYYSLTEHVVAVPRPRVERVSRVPGVPPISGNAAPGA